MKQGLLIMGLMAGFILLSGCQKDVRVTDLNTVGRMNNAKVMTLQRGMTPQQVINHIGPSGRPSIPNPYKSDLHPSGDRFSVNRFAIIRVLYFYNQRQREDNIISDNELMPVVFINGKLDGWGSSHWESTAKKYDIPIRHR